MVPIQRLKIVHHSLLAILARTAALAATGPERQVRDLCHGELDAVGVRALFFNQAPAEVVLLVGAGGAEHLLQQRAASGARDASSNQVFWIKGTTATWERGRTLRCQVIESER